MYRVVVFFNIYLVAVYAEPSEEAKKCMRLLQHDTTHCCMRDFQFKMQIDDLKECMQLPRNSPGCERQICMGVKKGFASADGKIDNDALKQHIERDLTDDTDLIKSITENCVNADLSKYGPTDMCDLLKLQHCMEIQFITTCPKWNNEGSCSGTKELAIECVKKFI